MNKDKEESEEEVIIDEESEEVEAGEGSDDNKETNEDKRKQTQPNQVQKLPRSLNHQRRYLFQFQRPHTHILSQLEELQKDLV